MDSILSLIVGSYGPPPSKELERVPLHIPDKDGYPVKTELVLFRTPEHTEKINWWHQPDINRGLANICDINNPPDRPHNHPGDFTSKILHGGYTEWRYWVVGTRCGTAVRREVRTYHKGDIVYVPSSHFHLVVAIEPNTVTHMTCDAGWVDGKWGYLDIKTGKYTESKPDPKYLERLRDNNRFLIPKKDI